MNVLVRVFLENNQRIISWYCLSGLFWKRVRYLTLDEAFGSSEKYLMLLSILCRGILVLDWRKDISRNISCYYPFYAGDYWCLIGEKTSGSSKSKRSHASVHFCRRVLDRGRGAQSLQNLPKEDDISRPQLPERVLRLQYGQPQPNGKGIDTYF
jgi:hypothetical protein